MPKALNLILMPPILSFYWGKTQEPKVIRVDISVEFYKNISQKIESDYIIS